MANDWSIVVVVLVVAEKSCGGGCTWDGSVEAVEYNYETPRRPPRSFPVVFVSLLLSSLQF